MKNLNTIYDILKKDADLVNAEGELLKNVIYEKAMKMDASLLRLLYSEPVTKEMFFTDVDGVAVFDKVKFGWLLDSKDFLPDSYTMFKNKIMLVDKNNESINKSSDVVISFPYKECVLEGGQTREDEKRDEIYYNEILGKDSIDTLLAPKALVNAMRYSVDGGEQAIEFTGDDNLVIKGNNLLAISSVKERYKGLIKMIYIDIPYNTGSDSFRYNDNFNHSTWLVFMKNRLEIAKELLKSDGIIFVQSDDNEHAYLKVLMDEVFGRDRYVNTITVEAKASSGASGGGEDKRLKKNVEFILCYWVMEAGITVREKLVEYLEKIHEQDEKTCPEELKTGFATLFDYGKYQYELQKKYGYRNHVDWALDNWGSSWNAFDIEKEENTLKFTTYTSSIGNLMLATSAKFPDVNIVYEFCSQDLEGVGRLTIKAGKMVSVLFPNAGTEKQLELATEILGYRPEI